MNVRTVEQKRRDLPVLIYEIGARQNYADH